MLHGYDLTNMEKDECRSLSKTICLEFARDQLLRAQQLLERFRLCECPDIGGFECRCVSEEVMEAIRNKSYKERSIQTEESNGESAVTEKLLTKASEVLDAYSTHVRMAHGVMHVYKFNHLVIISTYQVRINTDKQ